VVWTTLRQERKQVVTMPLGQGIGEMWGAVRDRVEVAGQDPTWEVTAGSFDSALAFVRERFGDAAVLSRRDRNRWWPRVTLTVTTDPGLGATAPRLEDLESPAVPTQRTAADGRQKKSKDAGYVMPLELEAIFAHQEQQRLARDGVAESAE
jgi:hypothetical protein